MDLIRLAIAIIFVLSCGQSFFSQTSTHSDPRDPRPEYMKDVDAGRARQDRQVEQAIKQARSAAAVLPNRETLEQRKARELEKLKRLEEINSLLAAPPEYLVKHADFLKSKKTGISRIFPDRGCDKGLVVSVQELERCSETPSIIGAGSVYSFRLSQLPDRLSLESILYYISQSDIHFIDGKFEVGTKSILDIIGDIGEVELEQVTLKSDSVKFLSSFKPANSVSKVVIQNKTLKQGVNVNGYFYSTSTPVLLNHTYVLRSIAFKHSIYDSFWNTDILTAFKVVGQEKDGSVVILWKELKRSRAPYIDNK